MLLDSVELVHKHVHQMAAFLLRDAGVSIQEIKSCPVKDVALAIIFRLKSMKRIYASNNSTCMPTTSPTFEFCAHKMPIDLPSQRPWLPTSVDEQTASADGIVDSIVT